MHNPAMHGTNIKTILIDIYFSHHAFSIQKIYALYPTALRLKLFTDDKLVQTVYIPLASKVQTVSGTRSASYLMEIA
jgi:hypothetical protein